MSDVIDRTSPVPYYEQLYGILRDRVVGGAYAEDARLPAEMELSRDFGLSRATVRQTLQKLEAAGLARKVSRRGFFASVPVESSGWTVQDTQGFLEAQLRHGRRGVSTEVVSYGRVTPPAHVRTALQVAGDDEVFALERVRRLDGEPVLVSTNWLPAQVGDVVAAAVDVLDGSGSLDRALRRAGHTTAGAHRVLEALLPPKDVAHHLGISTKDPVLRIRSWSWGADDIRFDYYETWLLTRVMPVEVEVAASNGQ